MPDFTVHFGLSSAKYSMGVTKIVELISAWSFASSYVFNFAKIASKLACYVNSSFIVAFVAELPSLMPIGQELTMANR